MKVKLARDNERKQLYKMPLMYICTLAFSKCHFCTLKWHFERVSILLLCNGLHQGGAIDSIVIVQ